ncbi:MAG: ABC transporter substrate-binding protein [Chloroflexi bacterium]|nr:ABC transporter substrate-binding protein [Chloroflexota bacterium]
MRRGTLGLLLFWVLGLSVVLGCGPAARPQPQDGGPAPGQPKYGGIFRLERPGDPPSFDLHQESVTNMQQATWAAYNNLIMYHPHDPSKIVPDAAARWEVSKDGKEVTFFLHKSIRFHDGTPMTAADVKFSLERMKNPPRGMRSPRKEQLDPITRIETPDDYTVKLALNRPYAALMPVLAQGWMGIYSKAYVEAKGHEAMKKEMMGTGAFRFKEYLPGVSVEIQKNPDYWQPGLPYLDGVMIFIIPDAGTRLAAFRSGQVDLYGLSVTDAEEMERSLAGQIAVHRGPSIAWQSIHLNVLRSPFNDLRVRQAISLAMDRRSYIQAIQQGGGILGGYLMPGSSFALPEAELAKLPGYGPDVEANRREARRLLAEAGFPNGFKTTMLNLSTSGDLGIYVQDQLKRVGIETPITLVPQGPGYDLATAHDFDILPWGFAAAIDDVDALYAEHYLCGTARNYGAVCDEKVGELFMAQSSAVDFEQRKKLVGELERYALSQVIKITLSWSESRTGIWNYVKDYLPHPGGRNERHYKQVWLDK